MAETNYPLLVFSQPVPAERARRSREDAAAISEPIRYGLAVTLEMKEGVDISIPIYQEVRARLGVRIAV